MAGYYRPDKSAELDTIEQRRIKAKITCEELASQADLTLRTFMRIRREKRAFPRTIRALQFALRTLEKRQREGGSS